MSARMGARDEKELDRIQGVKYEIRNTNTNTNTNTKIEWVWCGEWRFEMDTVHIKLFIVRI